MRYKAKKLYNLTPGDFTLPVHVDRCGKIFTALAHDIPMLAWPDGRWCLPANIFMLEQFRKGLSRRDGGGTLKTYATNISHLIRYCYKNNFNFLDLSDNDFTLFMGTIADERNINNFSTKVRGANHVISIGRTCLEFLSSVGRLYQDDEFVGPNGQILAEQKEYVYRGRGIRSSKQRSRKYWHHHSFPTPDAEKRRSPITSSAIEKLRNAVLPSSRNIYQRKRRYVMLMMLEITGGRRTEVAQLTVESTKRANSMDEPMLELLTAKRPGGREEFRSIPITRNDLRILIEFIDINRQHIIRKTCGAEHDDGYVLLSSTTGLKLRANTVTQEISILAEAAGIDTQVCPHMFRHRFITKLFVALIEQHEFENPDSFRRALLDVETLKQKVQQWTGHTNLASLDHYIDLAFGEIANFKKTYNAITARRVIDSFKSSVKQLQQEIKAGMSLAEASRQFSEMLDACDSDLRRLEEETNLEI